MEFSGMMGILMEGFALTAEIFLITLVGSLPLGVVVALARMSKFKPLAWLAQLYISILRGTPLMLQLMAIMFGPYYLFGLNMGGDWKFWACAIGFILNYAAYFAEIFRSGIQSIPAGQYEAAKVLAEHDILVKVDMGTGEASAKAWGCDLTYDYVKINGDYRT